MDSVTISSFEEYKKRMADFERSIKAMLTKDENGNWRCPLFIFSGEKGVGKSYVAEKVFMNQDVREFDEDHIKRTVTAFDLYKFMWEHPDGVIILDDADQLFEGSAGVDLLKNATEKLDKNKKARVMQWSKYNPYSINITKLGRDCDTNDKIRKRMDEIVGASSNKKLRSAHEEGRTFPNKFFFTGNVIILTNLPLRKFTTGINSALGNRSEHLEIHFTLDGAMDLIRHSADKVPGESKADINKAIKFLTGKMAHQYCSDTRKQPTIRNLQKVTNLIHNGHPMDTSLLDMCLEYKIDPNNTRV